MSEQSIAGDRAPESLKKQFYNLLGQAREVGSGSTGVALPGVRLTNKTTRREIQQSISFLKSYISRKGRKEALKSNLRGGDNKTNAR
jgi:hypothetical protein